MFSKLEALEQKFEELTAALADPEVISETTRYQKTAKARADLAEIVEKYRELKEIQKRLRDTKQLLVESSNDAEMKAMAQHELQALETQEAHCTEELKLLVLPKNPMAEKNVILERRVGTVGADATLFAAEVFRMYSRCAEPQGWRVDIMTSSDSGIDGYRGSDST